MTLAAPDWSQVSRDVICPLCDYNLRGLADNRCPECGYVFDWGEVLHPEIVRHPYLFEHNSRRSIRSFFATLIGGMRPRRFWRSLRATHRPVLTRLLLYAFLCAAMVLTLPGATFLRKLYDLSQFMKMQRAAENRWLQDPMGKNYRDRVLLTWPNIDAYLDSKYPAVMSAPFMKAAWNETISVRFSGRTGFGGILAAIPACIAVVLWPWLTFATLMIFLASMRRASVRPAHVIRCAVYSSDAIWLVPILFALMPTHLPILSSYMWGLGPANISLIAISIAYGILVTYRLGAAYGLYLKFPHAAGVAIASQLMIVLTITIYALNVGRRW